MTTVDGPVVPYEQAINEAGQEIADGLVRQAQRSPREAAKAALGRDATEQQIADWIAAHRPERAQAQPA